MARRSKVVKIPIQYEAFFLGLMHSPNLNSHRDIWVHSICFSLNIFSGASNR